MCVQRVFWLERPAHSLRFTAPIVKDRYFQSYPSASFDPLVVDDPILRSHTSRMELALENLALRQQVATLKRERPRPMLTDLDRSSSIRSYSACDPPLTPCADQRTLVY